MKSTTTRVKRTPEELRAMLTAFGLREEEMPIAGFAFTYRKEPQAAMSFYAETHSGREPTRFYLDRRSYILAE